MKTKSLFIVVSIFLASCNKVYFHPTEMLTNGNMELGTSTQPESWFIGHDTANISMSWTTAESSSPTHSLEMSCATATPTAYASWGQTYQGAIPIGKDLTFSVKIKADNLQGDGVSIVVRTDNSTTPDEQIASTQGQISIKGTFNWTTYTVKLPNVASDIKYIDVYCVYLSSTTGTVYFDDASLTHD